MVSRPLVYVTLAFVLGIITANITSIPDWCFLITAIVTGLIAVAAFSIGRKDVFLLLLAAFLFSGAAMAASEKPKPGSSINKYLGREVTLEGYICKEPVYKSGKVIYELKVERLFQGPEAVDFQTRVLVYSAGRHEVLWYGDAVRLTGRPFLPKSPGNPGQFDYPAYLWDKGIWALITVKGEGDFEKTGSGKGYPLARTALRLKQKLVDVNRKTMEPAQAALVNGIVFGSRGEIEPGITEAFNETGIVHILAVSGLNVGLVAAGVMGLLNIFRLRGIAFPAITAAIIAYTYITGLGVAVVRAAIMAWIYFCGRRLGRERDWPVTMSAAALIILVFSPNALFEPGFQLSFGATWGILHVGPYIDEKLKKAGLDNSWLRGCLWVTLAAQLGTLPLVVYYFNIVSLVSILANLFVVPLVGLILPIGIVASLAGLIHLKIALFINSINAALLEFMMFIAGLLHQIPGGVVYAAAPPMAAVFIYYLCLFVIVGDKNQWYSVKPAKLRIAVSTAFFIMILLFATGYWSNNGNLQVHVLDVGQGDSILFRFPNGKNMLVDAGGWKEEYVSGRGAGQVVASYLRRLGINKIDALILSHPHEDHCAGALFLYEHFDIGWVFVSPVMLLPGITEQVDFSYIQLLSSMEKKGIRVKELFAGDVIDMDPMVEVKVLGPGVNLFTGTKSDLNNNSLIISVKYGGKSFLMTGDIEMDGQAGLMERLSQQHGFDVLKVPHHGSRYVLPEFIQQVDPDYSVISVGQNAFGHPDQKTVEMFQATGPVYRTDRDGLVVFNCDGKKIEVETYHAAGK